MLDICQLLLCRGKNFDRTFTHPKCPVRPMYPKFGQLLQLQQKYDPAEMLKPRLFQKVADKEGYTYIPGCRCDLVGGWEGIEQLGFMQLPATSNILCCSRAGATDKRA